VPAPLAPSVGDLAVGPGAGDRIASLQ